MIQVYDGVLAADLCAHAIELLRAEELLDPAPRRSRSLEPYGEASPDLADLCDRLHASFVHALLLDFVEGAGLSADRVAYLPGRSLLTHEHARAAGSEPPSEPVAWPADGICLVACLNDGGPNAARVFPKAFNRPERRVPHKAGRVLAFPTAWPYRYALEVGDTELFSLLVFASVAPATRLYDLDDHHGAGESDLAVEASSPQRWSPSPVLGYKRRGR